MVPATPITPRAILALAWILAICTSCGLLGCWMDTSAPEALAAAKGVSLLPDPLLAYASTPCAALFGYLSYSGPVPLTSIYPAPTTHRGIGACPENEQMERTPRPARVAQGSSGARR
jgi:hypothetical protein